MDQELVQYLDERFQRLEERFTRQDERFARQDERFDRQDQRFAQQDERFDRQDQRFNARFEEVNVRLDERIDEVKRHTGVLVEGLRHEVHLVAEGLAMHIQVQHAQEREYFDRKFDETNALIRSSYDHLHRRVENLERKFPN